MVARADSTRTVFPARQLPGVSHARFAQRDAKMHAETLSIASVAATRALGEEAAVTGGGARIYGVAPGSPASGVLRPDDVIVALHHEPVTFAPRLVASLDRLGVGGRFPA